MLSELRPWAIQVVKGTHVHSNEVEDVVQVAFAEAAAHWMSFRAPLDLPEGTARRRWIAGFLFIVSKGFYRTAQKHEFTSRMGLSTADAMTVESCETAILAHDVFQKFEHCTTPERWRAWLMREIDGMDIQEIARQEGTPVNTIFNRLHLIRLDFAAAAAREMAQANGPLVDRRPKKPRP